MMFRRMSLTKHTIFKYSNHFGFWYSDQVTTVFLYRTELILFTVTVVGQIE